jgi:hypothetical protein
VLIGTSCWHQFKPPTVEKRTLQSDQYFENKDGDKAEADLEVLS